MNRAKLKEILAILSPDGTDTDFKAFDEGVDKLKKGLKEKIQVKTLEDVNGQLRRFKENLDLAPLLTALKDIDRNFDARIKRVAAALAEEVSRFDELSKVERQESSFKMAESSGTIESLRFELDTLKTQKNREISDLREALLQIPAVRELAISGLAELRARFDQMDEEEANEPDLISPIKREVAELRIDLITKINNIPRHGDHANRNIAIGGNTSVLSRYTDINLKAGANTTITYAYNDTTKYTDVTVSATGGGGLSILLPVSGTIDDTNTVFTFASTPTLVIVNGTSYRDGHGVSISGTTATLDNAVGTNGDIYSLG